MRKCLVLVLTALWCATLAVSTASAQGAGASTSLSGVVKDKDGGVVPGATVTVKNTATGVESTTQTNGQGVYSFPTLSNGTYTISFTMTGFKKYVANESKLISGQQATLNVTLEIGAQTDEVTITAGTDLVRTSSPTISSTISGDFIKSVPRATRNALDFLIFLPGVQTSGGSQNSRGSTISGLPQNTINISIDGVNVGNNLQSGDGFFALVTPRLDAVEEVTLTTATTGADSAAQGATQVKFVTKSGTNTYKGTGYEYFDHKSLNSNTFFNRLAGLGIPRRTIDTFGGSLGGPIVIPNVVDGRGKAFFFYNHEYSWTPNEVRRTRTIAQPHALLGDFRYNLTNPTTVNVMDLAKANGQLATFDPTLQALLLQIDAATKTTGNITTSSTNLMTSSYDYFVNTASKRNSPTTRVDINLTSRHRVTGTYYWQGYQDDPDTLNSADPTFPGFPAKGHQNSFRTTGSYALKSTMTSNLVNEVTGGWQWSPVDFFGDANAGMFANSAGFFLNMPNIGATLTGPASGNFGGAPEARNTINWNVDDNLSWLKGNHSFKFGYSFTQIRNWIDDWDVVPSVTIGFNTTNDPAAGMFNTTNFPGASNTDLNAARALYALMTGRITSIGGQGRLNAAGTEYIYNGHQLRQESMDEHGFYAQDSWRVKPNVTMSLGLRYELQMPMHMSNNAGTMATLTDLCGPSGLGNGVGGRGCNIYNPGSLLNPTQIPTYVPYSSGNPGYNTDYNNFAPSIGIAYRPNITSGIGRTLLGDPEQAVVTAGYTRSFNRERIDRFQTVYEQNPGPTTPATRNTASTGFCLVCPGESWPILLSQPERLGPPAFQKTPVYPIVASFSAGNDIRIFDPAIEVPYTDSWSASLQRSLGKSMAVEVRYIGNQNKKPWSNENWNVANMYENGLLAEFRLAQRNLLANVAAGRGGTFAYFGEGTGTSPLPIFMSHFTGRPASEASDPTNYTVAKFSNAAQFTNSTWTTNMDPLFPNPQSIATSMWTGNSGVWRNNGLAAGFPLNFWVMNPLVDQATVMRNLGGSKYNSLQIDLRRRLSQGLAIQGSYTFARGRSFTNFDSHFPLVERQGTNIPHAIKLLWVYDVPVGRGKRFGTDMNKWLDGVIGGWTFSGAGRIQQPIFRLTNTKLVGMSFDEAQKAFGDIRINTDAVTGAITVWNMPLDITDNTRKAYNRDLTQVSGYPAGQEPTGRYFAPSTNLDCIGQSGAGLFPNECSPDLIFHGKWFGEFDLTFNKRWPISKAYFDFRFEVFNAFMAKNFSQTLSPSNSANVFRITSTASAARVGQMVFRISF